MSQEDRSNLCVNFENFFEKDAESQTLQHWGNRFFLGKNRAKMSATKNFCKKDAQARALQQWEKLFSKFTQRLGKSSCDIHFFFVGVKLFLTSGPSFPKVRLTTNFSDRCTHRFVQQQKRKHRVWWRRSGKFALEFVLDIGSVVTNERRHRTAMNDITALTLFIFVWVALCAVVVVVTQQRREHKLHMIEYRWMTLRSSTAAAAAPVFPVGGGGGAVGRATHVRLHHGNINNTPKKTTQNTGSVSMSSAAAAAKPRRVVVPPPPPPPLCSWDPQACRHLNATVEALQLWRARHFSHRHRGGGGGGAAEACPNDNNNNNTPVRLELRGSHFRSWWGHVIPNIMQSISRDCPVPCDMRWAPFPQADVVVDSMHPGAPIHKDRQQRLALVALESAGGPGGRATHSSNSLGRVDFLVTWSRRSSVPINYMYAWQNLCPAAAAAIVSSSSSPSSSSTLMQCMAPVPTKAELASKRLAAVFVSNCGAADRLRFMRELFSHLAEASRPIDSWGRCLRTPGLPSEQSLVNPWLLLHSNSTNSNSNNNKGGRGVDATRGMRKLAVLAGYKFVLAFENSIRHDYVTEKALHPILSGALPVTWGAPEVADFMPGGPGSFINALNFANPRALAEHLLLLDADDALYLQHFDWRRKGGGPTQKFVALQRHNFVNLGADSWPCRLCQAYRQQQGYCPSTNNNSSNNNDAT